MTQNISTPPQGSSLPRPQSTLPPSSYDEWAADLQTIPKELQAKWVKTTLRSKRHLHIFGRYFFPRWIEGEQQVPQCHIDLLNELAWRQNGAIIFPRNHAKSTWIAIDTLHDIVYGVEPVIIYVGKTMADAQLHFDGIKDQLETNKLLLGVYGSLVPEAKDQEVRWTNKHFETTNGVTVIARGAQKGRGVKVKGQRPTKIILDDIEDDTEIRSSDQRAKMHLWVEGTVMQALDRKRGFVKMVGTVLHPKSELVQFYANYGGIFRKAIENGVPIWWTLPELKERERKMGSLLFRQEYMNEPITESEQLVKEAWLIFKPRPILATLDRYTAIDPAISKKTTADYTAVATVGKGKEGGKLTLIDMVRDHLSINEQVKLVLGKYQTWKPLAVGVETVAYQEALKQELDRIGAEQGIYPPTQELDVDGDKVRRFMRIQPLIQNGTIEFADDLPEEFKEELLAFPHGEHDDMVDAFVYAVLTAIEGPASMEVVLL